jgi:DNA-binding transcriptional regulator LsrR (DeoR family)
MAVPPLPGPAHLLLVAAVARRHYLKGQSRICIADELGISRFKVARLLEQARESGLVRIEIGLPGVIDLELSGQVEDMFSIKRAVVLQIPDDDETAVRLQVGRAAAELLEEILGLGDVLGLTWSRTVTVMVGQLTRLPPVPVVQLCGALAQTYGDENSVELVRQVARVTGGPAHYYYVPMLVNSDTAATALRHQPEVSKAFEHFSEVTKAVVGIGGWAPGKSTLYDSVEESVRVQLREQKACAEVAGVLIDGDGQFIENTLARRVVGISGPELRAIPEVIGVPYDHTKPAAIRAALRGDIVNSLVMHTSMARSLLELGP